LPTDRVFRHRTAFATIAACALLAPRASAQSNAECAGYAAAASRNVCNAAFDLGRVYAPQFGSLIAGGNQALDATGSGALGIRVNGASVTVPEISQAGYTGAGAVVAARRRALVLVPVAEGRFAVLRRPALGGAQVDLLLSAQLLPTAASRALYVDANSTRLGRAALGFGAGARLAILTAGGRTPGIAMTATYRGMSRFGVGNTSAATGDRIGFTASMSTVALRFTGGREMGHLSLGIGGGFDWYRGDVDPTFVHLDPQPVRVTGLRYSLGERRAIGFADAGLNARNWHVVLEAGMQEGKNLGLATTFTDSNPRDARFFGSLGLRLGS
jgi:hypothetical protein